MIAHTDLLALVEEILETDPGTVAAAAHLEELGWDSISDLNSISIADERDGVTIDPNQLAAVTTPRDLEALLACVAA